ncbi:hypothetical protein JNUCC0626_19850 [Lentzea sp. JNUCC 0626]|uniref:hypothetical protein n=1 Tax=Lentzea sp. JNUCC 0626 TaxID=3367513 RepID=UPI0037493E96
MTTDSTASARGKASRRKGHDTERMLARYLRQWWPLAKRKADNGWRRGPVASADQGDIAGTPGIVWQAKYVARLNVTTTMTQATAQAVAAGADYAVVVERRRGRADPGAWWAWVTLVDLAQLLAPVHQVPPRLGGHLSTTLVRLELHRLVELLRLSGYGEQPGN